MVAEGKENEDFVYDLYDNHVCITKYKGNDASLKIPAEIEGLPVTRLKGQPKEAVVGSTVTSVELPDTVTIIDDYAFYKASIQTITLPASLTSIRWHAFMYCKDLENVQLPDKLKYIRNEAFFGCPKAFGEKLVIPDGIETIDEMSFADISGKDDGTLKELVIPDSVKVIGKEAFRSRSGLTKVTLGSQVYKIDDSAFSGCTSLKEIEISATVKEIWDNAFARTALESVTIPKNVYVVYRTFGECENLKKAVIQEGTTFSQGFDFEKCTALEELEIGSEKVPRRMCNGCISIKKVVLTEGVKEISENAFARGETDVVLSLQVPASVEAMDGCLGEDFDSTKVEIYGKKASVAETFAKSNNIKFSEE